MCEKYGCPRCGYETDIKQSMNLHLYKKKKPCPATVNNIELTDEIKEYILNNRVYKIPEPEIKIPIISEEVNSDFIDTLNIFKKIHKNMTIEEVSSIFYSKLFTDEDRTDMLLMRSLKEFIRGMKKVIFDSYEIYLIQNIDTSNFYEKLKKYYKFIAVFDITPFIKDKSDNYILSNDDENTFELSDKYMKLYRSQDGNLSVKEINLIKKEVIDIINKNHHKINREIAELFKIEDNFLKNNM